MRDIGQMKGMYNTYCVTHGDQDPDSVVKAMDGTSYCPVCHKKLVLAPNKDAKHD